MWNRVSQIEVPLMLDEEIDQIMSKGEALLNVRFSAGLRKQIRHLSNGLPSVCHQLCLNLCFHKGIDETLLQPYVFKDTDFAAAVAQWIEGSADSLRDTYDRATRAKRIKRFDNCRMILHALAELGPDGGLFGEVYDQVRRHSADYPAGNLTLYLRELQSEEREFTVLQDSASGRFSFSSPMMHAYVRAILQREQHAARKGVRQEPKVTIVELLELFGLVPK